MGKKHVLKALLQTDAYSKIKSILDEARLRVYKAVNSAMVQAYWEIGRVIVEEEQKGNKKAAYGQKLLENLSARLSLDFGQGFDISNLTIMRKLYLTYPILDALRQELSWTHYRTLIRIENKQARDFYEIECAANHWSVRELDRQKSSLLFERLYTHFVELLKADDPARRAFYETEAIAGNWPVRQLKRQIGSLLYERTALSKRKSHVIKILVKAENGFEPSTICRQLSQAHTVAPDFEKYGKYAEIGI